jgi:hypothetical protein
MNVFFQSMLTYYEEQQADQINKHFTDLINHNY